MKKFKYLIIIIFVFFSLELLLKYIGFGNPIIYINNLDNYYPHPNQNNPRYKGANIKINELGMRTNSNWKNYNNKKKIIFFGDSVTYGGSYIDNKNLFSQKICDIYIKNAICGNYGVNGYNMQNIYLRMKNLNEKYYDQIVIVVSSTIENKLSKFENFPFYERFNYFAFGAVFEILNHFLFKYQIYDAYHKEKSDEILNIKTNIQIKSFQKLVNKINKNKKIVLFILPTKENLSKNRKNKNFLELSNLQNIKIINLYDYMLASNYNNLYFNNAHLNKKGHDHIAKIIYDNINK